MFQDVSVAPVAKDDSFTLVQEGLAHFLVLCEKYPIMTLWPDFEQVVCARKCT